MAQPNPDWSDFQWYTDSYLPRQTVATLRGFADIIQNQTGRYLGLKNSELKASVVRKVAGGFQHMKDAGQYETYRTTRQLCEQRGAPVAAYRYPPPQVPIPTFGGAVPPAAYPRPYVNPSALHQLPVPSSSHAGYSAAARAPLQLADWKASPMWRPIMAATNIEMLPEIGVQENSHVRKERKVTFTMSALMSEKLLQTNEYFRPPQERITSLNSTITNKSIPIDYPAVPDVRVDDLSIPFKERGLRGKAGSAPPFDLGKSSRGLQLAPGRLGSVTFGHTGASTGKRKDIIKKFYFQIVLVEWTDKDALVKKLLDLPVTPLEQCLDMARKKREGSDDIEVGSSRMSLKDPLSYIRITQPIRSTKCSHQQCFDAKWWVESNAVHPQWHCPFCNKELFFADLIADGFFLSILQAVPEAIEEVILESDGEWHSEDNKYGSPAWLASRSAPVAEPEAKPVITGKTNGYSARELSPSTSPVPQAAGSDSKGKRKAIEILSSDDEDGPLARPGTIFSLPPSLRPSAQPRGSSSSRPSAAPNDQSVIDLTLSDSDDDVAGPSNRGGAGGGEADFRSPGAGLTGRSAAGAAARPPPARNSSDRNGQNGELDPSVRDRSGGMNGGGYGGAGGSHLAAHFYSHDDGLAMGSYRDGVDAFDAWDDGEAGPGAESRYQVGSSSRLARPEAAASGASSRPITPPLPPDIRRRYAVSSSVESDAPAQRPATPPLRPPTPPLRPATPPLPSLAPPDRPLTPPLPELRQQRMVSDSPPVATPPLSEIPS